MKITTVLEQVPVMLPMADSMERGARSIGDVDWKMGDWLQQQTEECFSASVLEIERKGPNAFAVPAVLDENTDSQIMVGTFCPFSAELFEKCPDLHIVGIARGGMENVDLEAATEHGIAVFNAAGRNANAVSDFAVGMMLSEVRNISRCHHMMMQGQETFEFPNSKFIPDLEGKTVGLVGFGNIGRLVARKLSGFDVRVIAYDPFLTQQALEGTGVQLVDKDTLFQQSDIVSIHARLSEQTYQLVGKHEIGLMKPHAYLINTARAGLVDYDALYDALANQKIAGAALDVFYEEPLPKDSRWTKLDNVTMTMHMAGATYDAQANSPKIVFRKIEEFLYHDVTRNVVNQKVLQDERLKGWLEAVRNAHKA